MSIYFNPESKSELSLDSQDINKPLKLPTNTTKLQVGAELVNYGEKVNTSSTTHTTPQTTTEDKSQFKQSSGANIAYMYAVNEMNGKEKAALGRIIKATLTKNTPAPEDVAIVEKVKARSQAKLDKIFSEEKTSVGLTYNEAKAIIAKLYDKYKGQLTEETDWILEFPDPNDPHSGRTVKGVGGRTTVATTKNMSEEDKKLLERANKAMIEIEKKYSLKNEWPINGSGSVQPSDAQRITYVPWGRASKTWNV